MLLYTNDLIIIADTFKDLETQFQFWESNLEAYS